MEIMIIRRIIKMITLSKWIKDVLDNDTDNLFDDTLTYLPRDAPALIAAAAASARSAAASAASSCDRAASMISGRTVSDVSVSSSKAAGSTSRMKLAVPSTQLLASTNTSSQGTSPATAVI